MKTVYQLIGLILIMSSASCLKDKNIENQKYGMINLDQFDVIEVAKKNNDPRGVALESKDEIMNLDFLRVHLAAESPSKEDIAVTLDLSESQTKIDAYNAEHTTNYQLLTPDLYQLPNGLKATIPVGSNDGFLKLNINPINLDPAKTYAIYFKIINVDKQGYPISGNFKDELIIISVKNQWHGKYKVTGFCFHPTAPRPIDEVKTLSTLGPVTMNAPLGDLYSAGYYFKFDISNVNTLINWANLGSTPASFALISSDNPSGTNQSLATIQYNQTIGQGEWVSSKYNNTYDPATKIFWIHYSYMGGNGAREFYEKWERQE